MSALLPEPGRTMRNIKRDPGEKYCSMYPYLWTVKSPQGQNLGGFFVHALAVTNKIDASPRLSSPRDKPVGLCGHYWRTQDGLWCGDECLFACERADLAFRFCPQPSEQANLAFNY
jgi:hypothetical protein